MTDKKTGENAFLVIGGQRIKPIENLSINREPPDSIFERLRGNARLERFLRFWLSFRLREASRFAGGKIVVGEAKAAAKKAVWDIAVWAATNEERFTRLPTAPSCAPGEHDWKPRKAADYFTGEIEIHTICEKCGDERFECFDCGSEIVDNKCDYCEREKNGNHS